MSKEIYLYSENKKYKCAVELSDSLDHLGCPDRSMLILTEERPDGTYVIAQARDRLLETEKDKKIAILQLALKKAVNDKLDAENLIFENVFGKGAKLAVPKKEQFYIDWAEKKLKKE